MNKLLKHLLSWFKPIRYTPAEKNLLLRLLEKRMEAILPDFKDALEAKNFDRNPPEEYAALRNLYQKIYAL